MKQLLVLTLFALLSAGSASAIVAPGMMKRREIAKLQVELKTATGRQAKKIEAKIARLKAALKKEMQGQWTPGLKKVGQIRY